MEDDDTVRAMAARALENEGYEVTAVGDGEAALRALAEIEGGVDLIVSDLIMPNLGGRGLGRIVAERFPGLPMLYIAGYSGQALLGDHEPDRPTFLAKPFTPEELSREVRAELDRARIQPGR